MTDLPCFKCPCCDKCHTCEGACDCTLDDGADRLRAAEERVRELERRCGEMETDLDLYRRGFRPDRCAGCDMQGVSLARVGGLPMCGECMLEDAEREADGNPRTGFIPESALKRREGG